MISVLTSSLVYLLASLLAYKYVALFLVAYLAALILPLPSNTSLIAASAFASQGYLNIYAVLIVALVANILGDWTGFWLSDKYGEAFLAQIGFKKMTASRGYQHVEDLFHEHCRVTIFVTRFFGGVGPLVNILSGLSKEISFRTFVIFDVLGETVYVVSLGLIGYFVGVAWEKLLLSFEGFGIVVAVLIIAYVLRKAYSHRRQRRS